MAIKSSDQISIVDITDAYSVILTNDSYTFPGSINSAKAGSCTTQILAMCGASQVAASVTLSEVTKPAGVTVTSDNNATAPTLTISVSTAVTTAGVVKIPVHVGDVTITKEFSFAIAFTGATGAQGATGATGNGVKSTAVTYAASSSGTVIPGSAWDATIPSVSAGQYLWTRTVITYTDGSTSTSYSVGMMGATGAAGSTGASGKGVRSTAVTYQKGTSGTWSSSIPTVAAGEYLWTRTVITYTDSTTSTSYCVGMMGQTGAAGATGPAGAAGADAITLTITSSNGTIFKNTALRYGSEGEDVKILQQNLIALGYDCGSYGADGDFGSATQSAVIAFQEASQLPATGIVDEVTQAKIDELLESTGDADAGESLAVPIPNGVTVASGSWNVRTGPGVEFASAGIVRTDTVLEKVDIGDWVPVIYNGEVRYISPKAVK